MVGSSNTRNACWTSSRAKIMINTNSQQTESNGSRAKTYERKDTMHKIMSLQALRRRLSKKRTLAQSQATNHMKMEIDRSEPLLLACSVRLETNSQLCSQFSRSVRSSYSLSWNTKPGSILDHVYAAVMIVFFSTTHTPDGAHLTFSGKTLCGVGSSESKQKRHGSAAARSQLPEREFTQVFIPKHRLSLPLTRLASSTPVKNS